MNERIFTELYKKVWGHFPCPTGEPELKKFAELIVRECADCATWAQDIAVEDIGGEVLKHFGVEDE